MAGEVEESFSINFQADSIHSGSISFGRFESEPLCWERRSSFSHNRYLEEVEKCSKPGLVIEKKAYFEAHFKRKGLFGISPARYDGSHRATGENDDGSERIGNQEGSESNDGYDVPFDDHRSQEDFELNEDRHYVQIEKEFQEDFELNEDDYYVPFDHMSQEDFQPHEASHYVKIEQRSQEGFEPNEEDQCVQFDELCIGSDNHGECGVTRYGREEDAITECPTVSFSSPQKESAETSCNDAEDASNERIACEFQYENETSNVLLDDDDDEITEEKDEDQDTANLGGLSVTMNESTRCVEKTVLNDPANPSPKIWVDISLIDALETKPESRPNSETNNVRAQESSSSRSSKDPARNHGKVSPRRTNMEKSLSKLATSTARSASRTTKQISKNGEKLLRDSKRENVSRVKKAVESQPSVLKTDSRGIQEAVRLNRALNSTKSDGRTRTAAFNFKSSERAERRKEFLLKMEEKLHAKEAEMNQMQAISQEKTEADIKKLRKSLNFKATPMPSFYRTLPSQSHGKKDVSNNTRSKKAQNEPKCPGSRADAALPLKMKMGSDQSTEPQSISVKECPETKAFEARTAISPSSSNTHQICFSNSGKKERAKVTSQKHRVPSESCKGAKRQSNKVHTNGEATKQRNETMRKGVRNVVGLSSSSRSGNIAVRVSS